MVAQMVEDDKAHRQKMADEVAEGDDKLFTDNKTKVNNFNDACAETVQKTLVNKERLAELNQ